MKHLYSILLACAFLGQLSAQPLLPIGIEPAIGNTVGFSGFSPNAFLDPGPAGANQNWDFHADNFGEIAITRAYLSPTNTPFTANFPSATRCLRTDATGAAPSFAYYVDTDSTVSTLGLGVLGGNIITNLAAWDRRYPFAFETTQTDDIAGTNVYNLSTTYFTLHYEQQYDAFGTLILPGGNVYQNVARLKTVASRRDSIPGSNGARSIRLGTQEHYSWYAPYAPGYLLWTSKYSEVQLSLNGNGDTTQVVLKNPVYLVEYRTSLPLPAVEPELPDVAVFDILGNPARETLHLQLTKLTAAPVEVLITGLNGQVLYRAQAAGPEILIPVRALPAGQYAVRVAAAGWAASRLWVKE